MDSKDYTQGEYHSNFGIKYIKFINIERNGLYLFYILEDRIWWFKNGQISFKDIKIIFNELTDDDLLILKLKYES